jgi:HK97 gp10 family phage protein
MNIKSETFDLSGFDELTKGFERLEAWAHGDILKQSAQAAAQTLADGAKRHAPVKSGRLLNAIKVRAGKARKGSFSFLASVGKKWFVGDEFYGAFQEFGFYRGKRKSFAKSEKGKAQGRTKVEGYHFMELGFEETKDQALQTFLNNAKTLMEREATQQ